MYLLWGSKLQEKNESRHIKRMADLLRQGATLTDLSCPACASPLFRLKDGMLWCAKCEKKVIVVKEGEEPEKASSIAYDNLETTLLVKVQDIQNKIQNTEKVEERIYCLIYFSYFFKVRLHFPVPIPCK